jgi:hypothetical protein
MFVREYFIEIDFLKLLSSLMKKHKKKIPIKPVTNAIFTKYFAKTILFIERNIGIHKEENSPINMNNSRVALSLVL